MSNKSHYKISKGLIYSFAACFSFIDVVPWTSRLSFSFNRWELGGMRRTYVVGMFDRREFGREYGTEMVFEESEIVEIRRNTANPKWNAPCLDKARHLLAKGKKRKKKRETIFFCYFCLLANPVEIISRDTGFIRITSITVVNIVKHFVLERSFGPLNDILLDIYYPLSLVRSF